jgi:hypothetical protein
MYAAKLKAFELSRGPTNPFETPQLAIMKFGATDVQDLSPLGAAIVYAVTPRLDFNQSPAV